MKVLASLEYDRGQQIGIGQGQNSEVFLADDPQLGGKIAIKEIPKANFGNSLSAFFAEAQAMEAAAHDHVVPVRYACTTPTHICLAMQYFKNGTLKDRIATRPLQLRQVLRVGQGILTGLAQVHRSGFIHFDVKPSNVLFDDDDEPMIADFGQARALSSNGVVKVPPLYTKALPPEAISQGIGTIRSDIFHAGLALYQAANGIPFYSAQGQRFPKHADFTTAVLRGRLPDRSLFLPHVPDRLRRVIRKALKVNPADRYHSATDLADDLGKVRARLDWSTEAPPSGGYRWTAKRDGQPDLIVEMVVAQATFSAEIYTDRSGTRRKKHTAKWKSGLTMAECFEHLREVFKALGA